MRIDLPANAFNVLNMAYKIISFDIADVVPYEDVIQFSYTESVNEQMEILGLEGQNTIVLLGSLNLVLFSVLWQWILIIVYSVEIPRCGNPIKRFRDRLRRSAEHCPRLF